MATLVDNKSTPSAKPHPVQNPESTSRKKDKSAAHHESNLRMSAFQRLNIGPVGPECLKNPRLKGMVDPTWTHIGGEPVKPILERWKAKWHHLNQIITAFRLRNTNRVLDDKTILERTHFKPFHYDIGKRINFPSGKFSFIFSENYFQRFFIDEADAQFRECFRMLEEGGVLRIVVPDADLRTYTSPEPLAFPQNLKWHAAEKHKTRWSIYSLVYVLENCGYHVNPIAWCDKEGRYAFQVPTAQHHAYRQTADTRFAFDLTYCANPGSSLIVDAIKPSADEIVPRGHLTSLLHPAH